MSKLIVHLFTLPFMPVSYLYVLGACLIGLAHKVSFTDWVLTAQWRPWFAERWRYSTTVGLGIIYQPDSRTNTRIVNHEHVHVRQHQDEMLRALLIGLGVYAATGSWITGLCIWLLGGAFRLTNFITAGLRFGWANVYRDSEHERSAYAQTDLWTGGKSWSDFRDGARNSS